MTTAVSSRQTEPSISEQRPLRVALLDLYDGEINLGIPSIQGLVSSFNEEIETDLLRMKRYPIRQNGVAPGLEYDLYISSGGPGSPYDGLGSAWEAAYFHLVDQIWLHNQSSEVREGHVAPKQVLFICHSFQMMCRHFELGEVVERKSQSFGVFETFPTLAGIADPLFDGLSNPFYVADFRDWQVIRPSLTNIDKLGASILAHEKKRPHVPLERAVMAIRLSREMVGVQFHPEANPEGMLIHFQEEKRRNGIIEKHGESKFLQIIERLKEPSYLYRTYRTIIPNFLRNAVSAHRNFQ